MLKKIIKEIFKCHHKNAILYTDEGYCPDCGKYVKKSYYIVRCACCDIKRNAKKNHKEILPVEKYCVNCGESDYVIEKCEKLNIVDVNYAIEVKEEIEVNYEKEKIEVWVEQNEMKEQENKKPENTPLIGQMRYIGAG